MSFGELKELLQTGGITMVIIVLGSVAAVVIGIFWVALTIVGARRLLAASRAQGR